MYLDTTWHDDFGGHGGPACPSCKHPITTSCATTELRFEPDPVHKLEEMNGTYHQRCAVPFLSLKRALDALTRSWGA